MVIKVNQQLSKNIICSWKITKITEPNNNYNIVSVAFFKKYELYKDFDIYINGLKSIINLLPQTLSNFKLRIYHDFSVSEIVKSLYKNREKLIELYEYDIPYFKQ
jgi:hypothetical protein